MPRIRLIHRFLLQDRLLGLLLGLLGRSLGRPMTLFGIEFEMFNACGSYLGAGASEHPEMVASWSLTRNVGSTSAFTGPISMVSGGPHQRRGRLAMNLGKNIRIMCPNLKCPSILVVPEAARGKNVKCSNCTTLF